MLNLAAVDPQLMMDMLVSSLLSDSPIGWTGPICCVGQLRVSPTLSSPKPGLKGHFAEFGVGLGGSSLFFGHMAAQWGRRMLAVETRHSAGWGLAGGAGWFHGGFHGWFHVNKQFVLVIQ